eukprot:m.100457 g.100457  ORF g.100457 m.100457 type:complete len:631 (+) comp14939_c0_seq1:183-2075(+)
MEQAHQQLGVTVAFLQQFRDECVQHFGERFFQLCVVTEEGNMLTPMRDTATSVAEGALNVSLDLKHGGLTTNEICEAIVKPRTSGVGSYYDLLQMKAKTQQEIIPQDEPLSAADALEEVSHSGWMKKRRGDAPHYYQRRWFVLHGKDLTYSVSTDVSVPVRGTIPLEAVSDVVVTGRTTFQIVIPGRVYSCDALEPNLQKEWIDKINAARKANVVSSEMVNSATSVTELEGGSSKQDMTTAVLGPANVFVSHAWMYPFNDLVEALIEHQRSVDTVCYFWVDLFANDQNKATEQPFDWWTVRFKESIAAIGKVLLVLAPWTDPIPLKRAWCLWEINCAIESQVEFVVYLAETQRKRLLQEVFENHNVVNESLLRIDAKRAEASNPMDKDMIFKAIDTVAGGFGALNNRVKTQLRSWLIAELKQLGNEADATSDGFGLLCYQIAEALIAFGLYDDAIEFHQKRVAWTTAKHGETHPEVASALNLMGIVHGRKEDYKSALQLFNQALVIQSNVLEDNDPALADTLANLGLVHENLKQYPQAVECYGRATQIRKVAMGPENEATQDIEGRFAHMTQVVEQIKMIDALLGRFEQSLVAANESGESVDFSDLADLIGSAQSMDSVEPAENQQICPS